MGLGDMEKVLYSSVDNYKKLHGVRLQNSNDLREWESDVSRQWVSEHKEHKDMIVQQENAMEDEQLQEYEKWMNSHNQSNQSETKSSILDFMMKDVKFKEMCRHEKTLSALYTMDQTAWKDGQCEKEIISEHDDDKLLYCNAFSLKL